MNNKEKTMEKVVGEFEKGKKEQKTLSIIREKLGLRNEEIFKRF